MRGKPRGIPSFPSKAKNRCPRFSLFELQNRSDVRPFGRVIPLRFLALPPSLPVLAGQAEGHAVHAPCGVIPLRGLKGKE